MDNSASSDTTGWTLAMLIATAPLTLTLLLLSRCYYHDGVAQSFSGGVAIRHVFPVSWMTTNIFLWMAWGETDSPRGGTGSGQSLMSTSASFCWRKFCTLLPVTLNLLIKVQQTSLYRHYINHSQTLFTLTFRSVSETFVRRSCSILLPVLATVVMRRGKKSVVRVAQCVADLIPVHRTSSLLSDVHCFLNASGTSIRLSIQDCRFWPVDYMVVMACIISQSWFILFWQTGQTLTSCEWFTCCCFHFSLVPNFLPVSPM